MSNEPKSTSLPAVGAAPSETPAAVAVKAATAATPKAAVARKRAAPSAAKADRSPKPGPTTKAASAAAGKQPAAPAPAHQRAPAKKAAAPTVTKKTKHKLVRDSFTMPGADFALIDQLKTRAIGFQRPAKKSELLRAGLQALSALSDTKLKAVLNGLTPLKAGRPKKSDA